MQSYLLLQCRLFDISPKGSVPVMKDLEKDKWVAGGLRIYMSGLHYNGTTTNLGCVIEACKV